MLNPMSSFMLNLNLTSRQGVSTPTLTFLSPCSCGNVRIQHLLFFEEILLRCKSEHKCKQTMFFKNITQPLRTFLFVKSRNWQLLSWQIDAYDSLGQTLKMQKTQKAGQYVGIYLSLPYCNPYAVHVKCIEPNGFLFKESSVILHSLLSIYLHKERNVSYVSISWEYLCLHSENELHNLLATCWASDLLALFDTFCCQLLFIFFFLLQGQM